MNRKIQSQVTSVALIAIGVSVSSWAGFKLRGMAEHDVPLNPCGINRSPYGQVFAMAMQGPIDRHFHIGMYGSTMEEMAIKSRENPQPKPEPEPGSLLIVKPDPEEEKRQTPAASKGVLTQVEQMITKMGTEHVRRTNPLPASPQLRFYLRRQAEDKLRFAYNLDPSHYANYAALHFFLAERITTRPETASDSRQLARDTIDYCLAIDHDPRPALTAAAACTNILHLMFTAERTMAEEQYHPDEMQKVLDELDTCLATYERIASEWDENGNWQLISAQRFQDCERRIQFITKIRDTADKTIQRIRQTYAN